MSSAEIYTTHAEQKNWQGCRLRFFFFYAPCHFQLGAYSITVVHPSPVYPVCMSVGIF